MIEHSVGPGDCFTSIAHEYGFFWETLWNLPENAALKERRGDPFTLVPGDVVHVPDRRASPTACATTKVHRFQRRGVPARLRMRVLSAAGEPRAGVAYVLEVDGDRVTGTTDGEGRLERPIPPNARSGRLVVKLPSGDEPYDLSLGELEPADTLRGAAGRLENLGLYAGPRDGVMNDALEGAIVDFQIGRGIEPSGELDAPTIAALRDAHGG